MRKTLLLTVILLTAFGANAQSTAADTAALTKLLNEFLAGASRNDAAIHDRFWADDLVYTGSGGTRRDKVELMKGVRSAPPPKPDDPKSNYSAQDVRIKIYGTTAVIAFVLVNNVTDGDKARTDYFLNTGTFVKRKGKWAVVAWQATRVPRGEDVAKQQVADAESVFHKAFLNGDAKALMAVTDETFVWTHNTGRLITRQQVSDWLGTGKLKYSRIENRSVTINIYGDAAVVRGISSRQHILYPDGTGPDAAPLETFYTITLVNKGGVWKVVAMQTGR